MATDEHGRLLSDDGNYFWDEQGKEWKLVHEQKVDAQGRMLSGDGQHYWDGDEWKPVEEGRHTWPPEGYPEDVTQWSKEQVDYWFGEQNMWDESAEWWSDPPTKLEVAEIPRDGDAVGA